MPRDPFKIKAIKRIKTPNPFSYISASISAAQKRRSARTGATISRRKKSLY